MHLITYCTLSLGHWTWTDQFCSKIMMKSSSLLFIQMGWHVDGCHQIIVKWQNTEAAVLSICKFVTFLVCSCFFAFTEVWQVIVSSYISLLGTSDSVSLLVYTCVFTIVQGYLHIHFHYCWLDVCTSTYLSCCQICISLKLLHADHYSSRHPFCFSFSLCLFHSFCLLFFSFLPLSLSFCIPMCISIYLCTYLSV